MLHEHYPRCFPPFLTCACSSPDVCKGDGHSALKRVCRASLRLSRSSPIRFSSGLFLHLATEACFTLLERAILPPGHEARRRILGASQLLVRNLARFAKVGAEEEPYGVRLIEQGGEYLFRKRDCLETFDGFGLQQVKLQIDGRHCIISFWEGQGNGHLATKSYPMRWFSSPTADYA